MTSLVFYTFYGMLSACQHAEQIDDADLAGDSLQIAVELYLIRLPFCSRLTVCCLCELGIIRV